MFADVGKFAAAEEEIPDDEQRPAVPDNIERAGDRAELSVVAPMLNLSESLPQNNNPLTARGSRSTIEVTTQQETCRRCSEETWFHASNPRSCRHSSDRLKTRRRRRGADEALRYTGPMGSEHQGALSHLYGADGDTFLDRVQAFFGDEEPVIDVEPGVTHFDASRKAMPLGDLLKRVQDQYRAVAELVAQASTEELERRGHIALLARRRSAITRRWRNG